MASRTPSRTSSRKRSVAHRRKSGAGHKTRRAAAQARQRATATATATAEISPRVRSQFEKLGERWKMLLPRLTKNGGQTSGNSTGRKRAPRKSARGTATRRR